MFLHHFHKHSCLLFSSQKKMGEDITDCEVDEISAAVDGYIAVTFDVLGDSQNETISGMVSKILHKSFLYNYIVR